jgi:hypothetical protein
VFPFDERTNRAKADFTPKQRQPFPFMGKSAPKSAIIAPDMAPARLLSPVSFP